MYQPALLHEEAEAGWAGRRDGQVQAAAADTPDDCRGIDVSVRRLVDHQLPQDNPIGPAHITLIDHQLTQDNPIEPAHITLVDHPLPQDNPRGPAHLTLMPIS